MIARLALVAAILAACEPAPSTEIGCGFEQQHLHARAEGPVFDDVELVEVRGGATLLWSDRSGLYVRSLDRHGASESEPRRIGVECPGGIAADVADDGALVVACARPADRDRARPGEVTVLRVNRSRARVIERLGPVGAESFGVDVAVHGERIVIGWRDADVFTARAMIAELGPREAEEIARPISTHGILASAPSLVFHEDALIAAWTESWFDPDGLPRGHLLVQREGDPPRPSLDVGDIDVRVRASADEQGLMVALRDRRPRDRDPRAFAGRLDDQLRLTLANLRSPARANTDGARPMLVRCGDHLLSVTTRDSSREVTLVSLRRLDDELRSIGPEQQIYEYHARFPHAVAACTGDRVLVAVGERQSAVEPSPRLRTFGLRCGPGIAHERTPSIEGQVLRKRGGAR